MGATKAHVHVSAYWVQMEQCQQWRRIFPPKDLPSGFPTPQTTGSKNHIW